MVQEKCNSCGYWNAKVTTFNTCRVFPTCPAAAPRLMEMVVGSFVWLENNQTEKVAKIKKRFDENSGRPFNVIELESGRDFHGDTGEEYFPRPRGTSFITVGVSKVIPIRKKQVVPVVVRKKERTNEKVVSKVPIVVRKRRM